MEEIRGLRNRDLDKFLPPRTRGKKYTDPRPTLRFVHSPIVDLGVPPQQQLESLVDDLAARIKNGERLYVHCWGGRGRSGLVCASLLARLYGVGEEEALQRVQRAYATRRDPERYKSPETDEQYAMVREYIKKLQGAKSI
jgi:protein-tyrosine phosphatase